MIKSNKTKEILNNWRKFEYRNRLNESQGQTTRQRPKISQRAKDLKDKLNKAFSDPHSGPGAFSDYSFFNNHGDEEMIEPQSGYQHEFQELADYINSSPKFNISDMSLGDFVLSDYDALADHGVDIPSLGISSDGSFSVPSGEMYYFGKINVDGQEIDVVYYDAHGFSLYRFIPSGSSSSKSKPARNYKNNLGGAWS